MKSPEEMKEYKREWAKKNRQKNLEEVRARRRAYYAANREARITSKQAWRAVNRERENASARAWRAANPERTRAASLRYREANPEKLKERYKEWYEKNLNYNRFRVLEYYYSNREIIKERWSAAYKADPEKYRLRSLLWQRANPEKKRIYLRNWYANNPGKSRLYEAKRRTGSGTVSLDILEILWELQCGMCAYDFWCRNDLSKVGFHLDHVMPLALGGRHEDANLQLLCPSCNLSKGPKHPDEFVRILRERLADLGL
jgi:5-methylcytosine-specific restriction endonuclease McrA